MAHQLEISQSAYSKLEKNETKLTVERLYKLAEILEITVGELLEIQPNNQLIQTNRENATGYLQQIENFHQESKEQNEKMIQLYESRLQDKDKIIAQFEKLLNKK